MKYTLDASLREPSARSLRLRRKREKEFLGALSTTALALFAGLVTAVKAVSVQIGTGSVGSVYGAFVLPNTAGGYILAGVIAFALGAAFTLLCIRYQKRVANRRSEEAGGGQDRTDPEILKEEEA
ncbi:MAG: glycosyltransferase [Oscillospiraceae bacterium]|nr:glycosyltransferase [Oscillospiraceae bacterium]